MPQNTVLTTGVDDAEIAVVGRQTGFSKLLTGDQKGTAAFAMAVGGHGLEGRHRLAI